MPTASGPKLAVAVWAIAADTQAKADRLASSSKMMLAMLHRGQLIAVPSPEKAEAFLREAGPMNMDRRFIVGPPNEVRAGIDAVAEEYGAEEVFVVNILFDHAARKRSYELLAGAYDPNAASHGMSVANGGAVPC